MPTKRQDVVRISGSDRGAGARRKPQPAGPAKGPRARQKALTALGLTTDVLVDALRQGELGALQFTPFHPAIAVGMRRWADTVAALRRSLSDQGWRSREVNSVPQVVNPAGTIVISVMSGNAFTGLDGNTIPQPRSARPKGDTIARGVHVNGQLAFFDVPLNADSDLEDSGQPALWLLLYYRHPPADGRNALIRAELSRPIGLSDSGHVYAWSPRILLPKVEVGPEALPAEDDVPIAPVGSASDHPPGPDHPPVVPAA